MHLKYTDGKAVDGVTVWDSAREDSLRNDIAGVINGNIDSTNISDGAISRAKMASGNQDSVQAITLSVNSEIVTIGGTDYPGVSASTSSAKYSNAITAKTSGTIVAVDYGVKAVDTATVVLTLNVASSDIAATAATLSTGSDKTAEMDSLSISVSDGDKIKVKVLGGSGTTKLVDPVAVVYLKRNLA